MKANLKLGDHVRYGAEWLRNTGQITGAIPTARGTITGFEPLGQQTLAVVVWEGWSTEGLPQRVNVLNLEKCRKHGCAVVASYCEHNRMGDPCGPAAGTCLDCGEACSCGEDLIQDHNHECPIHADLKG